MDLQTRLQRLEQQLNAFEKLHREELENFAKKLAAYEQLHADEVKMLREQLEEAKRASEA
ncbi:MAG: hypothetical protein R3C14_38735 [Caldilineaceae bacterium]